MTPAQVIALKNAYQSALSSANAEVYYNELIKYFPNYGELALGVVVDQGLAGITANNYAANKLDELGGSYEAKKVEIQLSLMTADFNARAIWENGDIVDFQNIGNQVISDYHDQVFATVYPGTADAPQAWTAYHVARVLGQDAWMATNFISQGAVYVGMDYHYFWGSASATSYVNAVEWIQDMNTGWILDRRDGWTWSKGDGVLLSSLLEATVNSSSDIDPIVQGLTADGQAGGSKFASMAGEAILSGAIFSGSLSDLNENIEEVLTLDDGSVGVDLSTAGSLEEIVPWEERLSSGLKLSLMGDESKANYDNMDTVSAPLGNRFEILDDISSFSSLIFLLSDEEYIATDDSEIILGTTSNNGIMGSEGISVVLGGAGDDSIIGDNGADILVGGLGNDLLWAGERNGGDLTAEWSGNLPGEWADEGADYLSGGVGYDTYYLSAPDVGPDGYDGPHNPDPRNIEDGNNAFDPAIVDRIDLVEDSDGLGCINFWADDFYSINGVVQLNNDMPINLTYVIGSINTIYNGQYQVYNFGPINWAVMIDTTLVFFDWETSAAAFGIANFKSGDFGLFLPDAGVKPGTADDDVMAGGAADETLMGGAGSDTYAISAGGGMDVIDEASGGDEDEFDAIQFTDILSTDVAIHRIADDLILDILGGSQSVKILEQFNNFSLSTLGVEEIRFADSITWSTAFLLQNAISLPITGGAATDSLRGGTIGDTINGGGGDDSIAGYLGADTLSGGTGMDSLSGDDGDDVYLFDAGDGQDVIKEYAFGPSSGGVDTIYFGESLDISDLIVRQAGDPGSIGHLVFTFQGSSDKITIWGGINAGSDYRVESVEFSNGSSLSYADLFALSIIPTAGNDLFFGDEFGNALMGQDGDDTLAGGGGGDTLSGGAGDDVIYADDEAVFVSGGDGVDKLVYVGNTDLVYSIASGDFEAVASGFGADTVYGSGGDDDVALGYGDDFTQGYDGDDTLRGEDGADTIQGFAGGDVLHGGSGADLLFGGDGDDVVTIDADDVTYSGDNGWDTLIYDSASDWSYALASGTFEAVVAGLGDDSVYGTSNDDVIQLGEGDDFSQGYAGADSIGGGAGDDVLQGFEGDDTLNGGSGADTIYGGVGDDTIMIGDEAAIYSGGDGRDTLIYEGGASSAGFTYSMMSGDFEIVVTGGNDDIVYGSAENDEIHLGDGDDAAQGYAGADTLEGGLGNDELQAFEGADWLEGGGGNDSLSGGSGNDIFAFGASSGHDLIWDFAAGASSGDIIRLANSPFSDFVSIMAAAEQVGDTTILTIDAQRSITLMGVMKSDLQQDDFLLV
jgi:Ca2+-binding RTX toxin-like protein